MGACEVGGIMYGRNSRDAFEQEFSEYEGGHWDEYGDYDGYAGTPDLIDYSMHRVSGVEKWSSKKLEKYISKRMENLGTRYGEVIDLGIEKYLIYKPQVVEMTTRYNSKEKLDYLHHLFLKNRDGKSAVLIYDDFVYESNFKFYANGTVAEMKEVALNFLVKNAYQKSIIMVTRNKAVVYRGEYKEQKKCTRESNGTTVIVPIHKYAYYGWAPC